MGSAGPAPVEPEVLVMDVEDDVVHAPVAAGTAAAAGEDEAGDGGGSKGNSTIYLIKKIIKYFTMLENVCNCFDIFSNLCPYFQAFSNLFVLIGYCCSYSK